MPSLIGMRLNTSSRLLTNLLSPGRTAFTVGPYLCIPGRVANAPVKGTAFP